MSPDYKQYLSELTNIEKSAATPEVRYAALAHCFQNIIDEATAASSINFSGPFAKTDHILVEYKVAPELAAAVHAARRRFRRCQILPPPDIQLHLVRDLEVVRALTKILAGESAPPVPQSSEKPLQEALPAVLRVIVHAVDTPCLICIADGAPAEMRLRPPFGNEYLCEISRPGTQLNLLGAVDIGAYVTADVIIYEPDFLVSISRIASCFESYGTDARTAIVRRMAPPANTEAIHLGNFASQLLDEELHCTDGTTYADSVRAYFRANALSLAACDIGPTFHSEARRQQHNIALAIRSHMRAEVSGFDPYNVMVEPVFFSETLGLQGRMDFLQLDFRVLLEQKAGKGEWPHDNFTVPRQRQPHFVQLLLYMAIIRYNYPDIFRRNGDRLSAFLLYSRYSRPLVAPGYVPELFAEAIDVRNRLVWYHLRLAEGDDTFLRALTADELNTRGTSVLWERYTKPQLEAILTPGALRDPLCAAYYYRMLRFVACEHTLAKIGNKNKPASGFAALWHSSLTEKLEAGNIYAGLTMVAPTAMHEGAVDSITMAFSDDGNHDMANFRPGDSVILYSYAAGDEPDATHSMVFRCTVTDIGERLLELSLRFSQSGALPLMRPEGHRWAIEHDYVDSSHNVLYQCVQAFTTMPETMRDLLLLRREPQTDPSRHLAYDHGDFNGMALRVKQARDLFLIVGPPGTGKTSHGLVSTLREQLADGTSSVLLLSYTNRAVDEICSRLVEEGLDFLRIGPATSCAPEYLPHLLSARAADCRGTADLRHMISRTRVFAATVSALNSSIHLLGIKSFDLAIIDEASQIVEPYLLGILGAKDTRGTAAIRKIVMIGDHRQLPAVVQQTAREARIDEPVMREAGFTDCRMSLFERLLRRYGHDPAVSHMLTRQGRMHVDIARFPSEAFYGDLLEAVPLPHQTAPLPPSGDTFGRGRMIFIDIVEEPSPEVSDKVNRAEASEIARLALEIYRREPAFDASTLGIIVPYRNQIAAVRRALADTGVDVFAGVTVDTVERFQGSQRKYIIYGFTVKRPYQLKFLTDNTFIDSDGTMVDRKLNVALTRAREYMVLVGNARLLSSDPVFASLIAFCGR